MTELSIYERLRDICKAHTSATEWLECHGFGVGYLNMVNTDNFDQSEFRKEYFYSEKWEEQKKTPQSMPLDFPFVLQLPVEGDGGVLRKGAIEDEVHDVSFYVIDKLYHDRRAQKNSAYAKRSREEVFAHTHQIGQEILMELVRTQSNGKPSPFQIIGKYSFSKVYDITNKRLAGTFFELKVKILGSCTPGSFIYDNSTPPTNCENTKACLNIPTGVPGLYVMEIGEDGGITWIEHEEGAGGGLNCDTLAECPVIQTMQDEIDGKQDSLGFTPENAANKNQNNGYAGLDAGGKVPAALLPSYVDDVLEYANLAAFPVSGETGKIYVAIDTNLTYRWSGSVYAEISASPGSTDVVSEGSLNLYFTTARVLATLLTGLSTATNAIINSGDSILSALGKLQKQISDNLSTLNSHTGNTSNPHSVTKSQVGLGSVDNVQQLPLSYLDTDGTLAANSDAKVATQKAVKTYADTRFSPDANFHRKTGTGTFELWYTPAINNIANQSVAGYTPNIIRYVPFVIAKETHLDRIALEITGAGSVGSVARLGIYASSNNLPTTLVVDAGTINANSATFQALTVNVILQPGLYFFAYNTNSSTNISLRALGTGAAGPYLGYPNSGGNTPYNFLAVAETYGVGYTLPNPATTPNVISTASIPCFFFRIQ